MSKRRYGKHLDAVYESICRLGETLSTPPTQRQIADDLDLPPQTVSLMMILLAEQGRIEWLTRYTYRVIHSEWQAPD